MSSYLIKLLPGNLLKVDFNPEEPASGDRIVADANDRLTELLTQKPKVNTGGILRINGPQSAAVAYTLAHRLAHLCAAIAVYDPKIARPGFDRYIVSVSHDPNYRIGDVLDYPNDSNSPTMKVALCGPPRSGKSCLREGLKTAISQIIGAPYPYVITACPDGEGSWFYHTVSADSKRAETLKTEHKGQFNPKYTNNVTSWVENTNLPLNIIDCGGQISPENTQILRAATHAIVLAGDALDENGNPIPDSYRER